MSCCNWCKLVLDLEHTTSAVVCSGKTHNLRFYLFQAKHTKFAVVCFGQHTISAVVCFAETHKIRCCLFQANTQPPLLSVSCKYTISAVVCFKQIHNLRCCLFPRDFASSSDFRAEKHDFAYVSNKFWWDVTKDLIGIY